MKKIRLLDLLIAIALSYFSLHLTFSTDGKRFSIREVGYHSESQTFLSKINKPLNTNPVVFQQLADDLQSARVTRYDSNGYTLASFTLPPSKMVNQAGETLSIPGKAGFLTHPDNGDYFVWFPQLGSNIYFFDKNGSFLWDKRESRYLQVSPKGRYILAAAGDHSRLMVLNPALQTLADFEGLLFTHTELIDDEEAPFQMCASFITGDVVAANLEKKLQTRLKLPALLKSIHCNLNEGKFIAQVEIAKKDGALTDAIVSSTWPNTAGNYEVKLSDVKVLAVLPRSYPLSLPLSFSAVVLPAKDNTTVDSIVWLQSEPPAIVKFSLEGRAISDIRLFEGTNGLVLTTATELITLDKSGITAIYPPFKITGTLLQKSTLYVRGENAIEIFELP